MSAGICLAQAPAAVPFQGCAADGQVGPVAAPHGRAPRFHLPKALLAKLTWYEAADTPGVLAPRGWHCFATYGSNGSTLYVSPQPLSSAVVFQDKWQGFAGPAVQISSMNGSTSGRFHVARNVARYFPAYLPFAKDVIAEGLEPAADFPRGAFPHDTMTQKREGLIEYETPAHTEGQGTQSRLQAGAGAILGFVFVSMRPEQDPYDVTLFVRLAPEQASLAPALREAMEATLVEPGK